MNTPTFKLNVLGAAMTLCLFPSAPAIANPEGGTVTAGEAIIQQASPTQLNINQTTDKAIIDWNRFNIGTDEQTRFNQPSAASVTLNRVTSEDPSQILGKLTANGQIFLVNPNGIYFGPNSQVDVAGLVATTHNISNANFLAGHYLFDQPGNPGASVINAGNIRIADTGIAAFVAPSVANQGIIAAKLGKIALASVNGFTLDFYGDKLLSFMVKDEVAKTALDLDGKPLNSFVENSGHIEAQGGFVLLTAKAAENAVQGVINQTGVTEASTVHMQAGRIILGQTGVIEATHVDIQTILDGGNGGNRGFIETPPGKNKSVPYPTVTVSSSTTTPTDRVEVPAQAIAHDTPASPISSATRSSAVQTSSGSLKLVTEEFTLANTTLNLTREQIASVTNYTSRYGQNNFLSTANTNNKSKDIAINYEKNQQAQVGYIDNANERIALSNITTSELVQQALKNKNAKEAR